MANPLTEALDNYLYALVRCGADDDPQECYHAEAQALRVMRANRIAACQHRGYVWQDKGPIGLLFTIIQHADDIEFPEDDPTSDTALDDAMLAMDAAVAVPDAYGVKPPVEADACADADADVAEITAEVRAEINARLVPLAAGRTT